jgi:acrylyl-CoA reductase (NADPH)
MKNLSFRSLVTFKGSNDQYVSEIQEKSISDLPAGNVIIRVHYSSVNYKDVLSAMGNKGVTRHYPHTPGIDAAGVVEYAEDDHWAKGDKVIVTGFDLGMNTSGGFSEYIRVPADWLVRLPDQMTLKEAMIYGTAGLTAGLSVAALLNNGINPGMGNVAISGATGGVGSVSIAILKKLGFAVSAISSKKSSQTILNDLGADSILARSDMEDESNKVLLPPLFAAGIDTVGGQVLATMLKRTSYGGAVTACGMVNGTELNTTVFPFILKGISLLGIDSVELSIEKRNPIWELLADEWKPELLDKLSSEISFDEIPAAVQKIYRGEMQGRFVVKII